uniref:F-box domain-containing protein n=1 Tax=Colletotrichum fructicola (strain Nara gc5) TaxID=1213859 RepID=L2G6W5_COLFN
MVSINDMPPEILEHICSYLVMSKFDAHPWKHRLATWSIAGIILSETQRQKRLLTVAERNPILYLLLRAPPALVCGHFWAPEQPLNVLGRTNKKVSRAADLAGIPLPLPEDAESNVSVQASLVLARHPNITELGLRGNTQDLARVCDLKRSDGGHLLPFLESILVSSSLGRLEDPYLCELESSHLTKILNLGAEVSDIFIENFWISLTHDLATQHLTAITLNNVAASVGDVKKLLKNARGLRSFAMDIWEGRVFASDVITELEEHCPALETLCLKFVPPGCTKKAYVGDGDPFSLRNFNNIRNVWIDNWSILRSIQEKPGPVTRPLNPGRHDWTSRCNEFMSTLPESVERLHFSGSVFPSIYESVNEEWSLIEDFEALAVDHKSGRYPKLREVAVEGTSGVEMVRKALEDCGLRVLSKAEKRPFLWF